jgi:hypothetical protein
LPSKKTPPVTGKGKAALQSATGRNLGIGHWLHITIKV